MSLVQHSIPITPELHLRIAELAKQAGKSEEQIVREAIDAYGLPDTSTPTAFDTAKNAGWLTSPNGGVLPRDLSTNPVHMDGFGSG